MDKKTIFKAVEVVGETKYNYYEIIEFSKNTINKFKESYEIEVNTILYDKCFYITHEPVWYVDIISLFNKEHWPDAFENLVISDVTGKALYKLNDHGVPYAI